MPNARAATAVINKRRVSVMFLSLSEPSLGGPAIFPLLVEALRRQLDSILSLPAALCKLADLHRDLCLMNGGNELSAAVASRRSEDLVRRSLLFDQALVKIDDMSRDVAGEFH